MTPIQIKHNLQVTSFGGSGTSMLLEFLQNHGLLVPDEPDWGIWKHLPCPPTYPAYQLSDAFRAVYLVTDPVEAVASVFRRGFHMWHAVRMQSQARWPANFKLKDYPHEPTWGLSEYLDLGKDCYGLSDHFNNWVSSTREQRGYPLMVIKLNYLWDNLESLFKFVGLPASEQTDFPKKRSRENTLISKDDYTSLRRLYSALSKKIEALPNCCII